MLKDKSGRTRPQRIWSMMKNRCDNTQNTGYKNYGGRGIIYDPKWKKFDKFWEEMKDGYQENLSLDRINVNGNYCKENCRWATTKEQALNKRILFISNMDIKYKGESVQQAAKRIGCRPKNILYRIWKGWTIEEAFTKNKFYRK